MVTQSTLPRAAHLLLGYTNTISYFTKRGNGKDDEDYEVRITTSWISPEPSFEDKDKLFIMYKIVNRVHNLWKTYHENKDKKGGPPHLKKPLVDKGTRDI